MKKVQVGILGCGAIAPAYIRNLKNFFSGAVDIAACADSVREAADKRAAEFNIPKAYSPEQLLADPAIELVINLTPARVHHAVNIAILRAGKHVFAEKPLALTRAEGRDILATAEAKRLQVGGAADTFLGGSLQFARKLIDDGRIGKPMAAHVVVSVGNFHSAHYHDVYRGALLDLGPYYLTALVALLGPIARISGATETRFPEKPHAPGSPQAGGKFTVDFPSTVASAFSMADGTAVAFLSSCDVSGYYPRVEIYGTDGILVLNDANGYHGAITLTTSKGSDVFAAPAGFSERGRGLGVAEMAVAIRANRAPRSSGRLMYHVLDAMLAMHDSSASGKPVTLESKVERPAPFDFDSLPVSTPAAAAQPSLTK